MPEQIFLCEPRPLIFKVADWLAKQSVSRPLDLSRCAVVLSTGGAARRLRVELARAASMSGTGVLPPRLITPIGLLGLNDSDIAACPSDTLLAWTAVIAPADPEKFPILLSSFSDLEQSAARIAQSLMEVCAILADAGLTPSSPKILRIFPDDEDRWREIEALYRQYLKRLQKVGLVDRNASHIAIAAQSQAPPGIDRIIVAGVPDLSPLIEQFLSVVSLPVTILIDAADGESAQFDAWGRPNEKYWAEQHLPLTDIYVLADPPSEAEAVVGLLGSAALCVADSSLLPYHQRALEGRGRATFDPAGRSLLRFECAAVSRLWISFCRSQRILVLRGLAEHPAFLQAFCQDADLTPRETLGALDRLTTEYLMHFLPDAVHWFPSSGSTPEVKLVATAERWRLNFESSKSLENLPGFLEKLYSGTSMESEEAAALTALAGILRSLLNSLLHHPNMDEELLVLETQAAAIYGAHDERAVELNGWLEVSWLPHEALVISGCTEGALPANFSGHPFLPDSARVALGLGGNAQRYARDVYLLHRLLTSRPPGSVRLTLSRIGPEGEPAKPSRLLFRCPENELPARVEKLFGSAPSLRMNHARQDAWKLEIPQRPPPTYLRVTAYGDYLECPLRFYLKQVLKMDSFDPLKSEMAASDFGTILHLALEAFSLDESVRDSRKAGEIERSVLTRLDEVLMAHFGPNLALPVRVQRESLRARLRKFADIQAAQRELGWRIVDAEVPFKLADTLSPGGLPVTAKIDRVEIHESTGQRRILDYKTYKSAKNHQPSDLHYGKLRVEGNFPEAEFDLDGDRRRWRQLQLPLYRALAALRWPVDDAPATTGYFLLPEKIEDSGIFEFAMDDVLFASALNCANAVAERVRAGQFWPPGKPQYEAFDDIFLGRDPAGIMSDKSRIFLQGGSEK